MIVNIIAGLLSGLIGSMGMGGGAVLMIYLAVFTDTKQITAGGINLLFFIPIAVTSVIIYTIKKQIDWKTVLSVSSLGIVGAVIGTFFANKIGDLWLSKIFGGFVLVLGILELFKKSAKK